jgi:hypothetical protein
VSGLVKFAAIAIGAAFCGVYSAQALQDGQYGWLKQSVASWESWPSAGSASVDPYTRAHFVAVQRLPISRFETLEFETTNSSDGEELDAGCTYSITGRLPPMRRWSLSAYAIDQAAASAATGNNSLTSVQATYLPDGRIVITLSPNPASGNWLSPNGVGEQRLLLRFFNSTQRVSGRILPDDLPRVERTGCQ